MSPRSNYTVAAELVRQCPYIDTPVLGSQAPASSNASDRIETPPYSMTLLKGLLLSPRDSAQGVVSRQNTVPPPVEFQRLTSTHQRVFRRQADEILGFGIGRETKGCAYFCTTCGRWPSELTHTGQSYPLDPPTDLQNRPSG